MARKPTNRKRPAPRSKAAERQARGAPPNASARPEVSLLHELQVHQVELEMQNEELRRAQLALEQARDRYVDLYDFAPVGYLTVSGAGRILEANLTSATLLRVERARLRGRSFGTYVRPEDVARLRAMLARPPENASAATVAEFQIRREDGSTFDAHLWARH